MKWSSKIWSYRREGKIYYLLCRNKEWFALFLNMNLLCGCKTLQRINCKTWKGHCDRIQDDFLRLGGGNLRFTKSAFYSLPTEWLYAVDQYDIADLNLDSSGQNRSLHLFCRIITQMTVLVRVPVQTVFPALCVWGWWDFCPELVQNVLLCKSAIQTAGANSPISIC